MILSIYKEGVFYKEEQLVINFKNFQQNKWVLEQYTLSKPIKSIEILPVKKQDAVLKVDDYNLEITFEQ